MDDTDIIMMQVSTEMEAETSYQKLLEALARAKTLLCSKREALAGSPEVFAEGSR